MSDWFSGKAAIVTGGSRGIGRAVVDALAHRGASLVINGRDRETLDGAVASVRESGGSAIAVAGDFTDDGFAEKLIDTAINEFGRIDFLVNNAAAVSSSGPVLNCGKEAFTATLLANTWPATAIIQAAAASALAPGSAIVNISSCSASRVHQSAGVYGASKAALETLTFALARELGPRQITVNAIEPGIIKTDLARSIWEKDGGLAESSLVPTQRLGEPSDIAGAVMYLLGPDARWVTGAMLRVDGGRFHVGGESAGRIGVFQ